jgi:sigma-B regulation protein RsbU (phosphoserine phosphatase)
MSILVVDDSEEGRAIFEAVLMDAGCGHVLTADSAKAAFSLLALDAPSLVPPQCPVDLVLLDVVMPDMDGFKACRLIRSDARYTKLPIVMTTALDDIESVRAAFNSGATDYLTKPLKRVDLVACVLSSLLTKREMERQEALKGELLQHAPFQFGEAWRPEGDDPELCVGYPPLRA